MMRLPWYVLVPLVLGLLLLGRASKDTSHLAETVDSLSARISASDSVSTVLQPQIAAWRDSASNAQRAADVARVESHRLAARARDLRGRCSEGRRPCELPTAVPVAGGERTALRPEDDSLVQAFDAMSDAYDSLSVVDSLNQLQLAAKDRQLAAQDTMLTALRRTRDAGRAVVAEHRKATRISLGLFSLPRPHLKVGVGVAAGRTILTDGHSGLGATGGVTLSLTF